MAEMRGRAMSQSASDRAPSHDDLLRPITPRSQSFSGVRAAEIQRGEGETQSAGCDRKYMICGERDALQRHSRALDQC
jgi:hypothetical protein